MEGNRLTKQRRRDSGWRLVWSVSFSSWRMAWRLRLPTAKTLQASLAMTRYPFLKFNLRVNSLPRLVLIFFWESHQGALMRHFAVISELLVHMETLGWKPYQADHEVCCASLYHNSYLEGTVIDVGLTVYESWKIIHLWLWSSRMAMGSLSWTGNTTTA